MGKASNGSLVSLGKCPEEMPRYNRYVVGPFAQRWKYESSRTYTVVEIFAKLVVSNRIGQILIRGYDKSNIDRDVFCATNRPERALLQNP